MPSHGSTYASEENLKSVRENLERMPAPGADGVKGNDLSVTIVLGRECGKSVEQSLSSQLVVAGNGLKGDLLGLLVVRIDLRHQRLQRVGLQAAAVGHGCLQLAGALPVAVGGVVLRGLVGGGIVLEVVCAAAPHHAIAAEDGMVCVGTSLVKKRHLLYDQRTLYSQQHPACRIQMVNISA